MKTFHQCLLAAIISLTFFSQNLLAQQQYVGLINPPAYQTLPDETEMDIARALNESLHHLRFQCSNGEKGYLTGLWQQTDRFYFGEPRDARIPAIRPYKQILQHRTDLRSMILSATMDAYSLFNRQTDRMTPELYRQKNFYITLSPDLTEVQRVVMERKQWDRIVQQNNGTLAQPQWVEVQIAGAIDTITCERD